jgi:NADPH2 dehydrogenase
MNVNLFSPGQIGQMVVKNRVVMPPMCMFISDEKGFPNEFHYTHYVSRAIHQVGLIVVEATAVSPEGRISATDLGIWDDAFIEPFKRIVDDCHKYGAKIILQIAHAGRKCEAAGETPIAPSAIKLDDRYPAPEEMTGEKIAAFVEQMRAAAKRAVAAGFDGVEIHGAHGYLINQFLSPVTNRRTDEYGGSPENRVRVLKQVAAAVREVMPPEKALVVRISAEEYCEEGLHPEDLAEMLNMLPPGQVDAIHVSTGGLVAANIQIFPGYQTKPAEAIKALTGCTTISGGLIYDPVLANEIVANHRADFVFVGRGLLNDAAWVIKAQKVLGHEPQWPRPYAGALSKMNFR